MVNFEEGTLIKGAYVVINGEEIPVHMPEYSGNTPMSPENLNKMQTDMEVTLNGTILYEDEIGITGISQVTLNDDIENYKRFKIVYDFAGRTSVGTTEMYAYNMIKEFFVSNSEELQYMISEYKSYGYYATMKAYGTTFEITRNRIIENTTNVTEGDYFYVKKIIGYEY